MRCLDTKNVFYQTDFDAVVTKMDYEIKKIGSQFCIGIIRADRE